MNRGKICISVCAQTAVEFNQKVKRAAKTADMVELRFDCLNEGEDQYLDFKLGDDFIQTFRPSEQGGRRDLTFEQRERFWGRGDDGTGADFEEDIAPASLGWYFHPVICSHHDFTGVPDDLADIYERMIFSEARIDIIKIAVQAGDITDSIDVWRLLAKARAENRQLIPIAMGEAGKWTRILGLAHGSPITYAALDEGSETAPGQISARDLIDVYRARELDTNTDIYGIIAGNTSYSMSPYLHNAAFKYHKLNAVFVPLQVRNLGEFLRRMVNSESREIELNFKGFAVTNPHKQEILSHLDHIDEDAERIGAVNTIKIVDGKLHGYNTDAEGFIEPLKQTFGELSGTRVGVFGAGGAARACVYALKKENAAVTIFARNPDKAKTLANEFETKVERIPQSKIENIDICVNTTPLGTKGARVNDSILQSHQLQNVKLVYDLVYNPLQTKLLQEAATADVPAIGGLAMLTAQAIAQQKIWTGLAAPKKEMGAAVLSRL